MARIVYRDLDEFVDAIHGIRGRVVTTARPQAECWLQVVLPGRLVVEQLQAGAPATFAGEGAPRTITIGLPATTRRIRIDGEPLDATSFVLARAAQPFTVCSRQIARWAGIVVPIDHPRLPPELRKAVTARAFGPPGAVHAHAPAVEIDRARSLVARICADDCSRRLVESALIRTAEEELISIAAALLEHSVSAAARRVGRPRLPRARIVARALALMEERTGHPVLIEDLCRATCVSERTLRNVFQEYFGVGPMRLLKVRQLSEVRTALMAGTDGTHTIANIARRFGLWDFGAFARNYKALYGETPSATLRRAPAVRRPDSAGSATWLRYAVQKFRDDPGSA